MSFADGDARNGGEKRIMRTSNLPYDQASDGIEGDVADMREKGVRLLSAFGAPFEKSFIGLQAFGAPLRIGRRLCAFRAVDKSGQRTKNDIR